MPKSLKRFSSLCTLLMTLTFALETGCTSSPPQPSEPKNSSMSKYNVNEVTEITFGKFDPSTDEHWMTVIKRSNPSSKKRTADANWEITSLPDGNTTQDRKANAGFIMHLLDALEGLRKVGDAPHGSLD